MLWSRRANGIASTWVILRYQKWTSVSSPRIPQIYLWGVSTVETLKIDKSFIDIIMTDVQGAKIIDSIINMAHTINMKVVAEGVETQEQLDYLQRNNCDIIQGYIFSQPITAQKAFELLKAISK